MTPEEAEKKLTPPMRRALQTWYTATHLPSGIVTNGMWKRGLMKDRDTLTDLGIAVMKIVQSKDVA